MKLIFPVFIVLLVTFTACSQSNNIPSPSGWKTEMNNGIYHFFPACGKTDYYVMPVSKEAGVGELESWIKQQGLKDIKAAAWTDMGTGKSQSQPLGSYYITTVKKESGEELITMYIAYPINNGTIRWAKIYYPPSNPPDGNVSIAVKHFSLLAKKENGNSNTVNQQADNNTRAPDENTGSKSAAVKSSAGIKGVVMHSETTTGVGGIVGYVVRPYLFFNDGSFYGLLNTDPYNLDPETSRRTDPGKWGHWQMKDKTIVIHWDKSGNNSEWTSSRWSWAEPAADGEKIAGSFSSISGGGNTAWGGASITMSSKYITFNKNGQFTFESVGGGGYSGPEGSNSAWSSHDNAGTYILSRYSIELHFNNGKVIKNGFNFYDNKKDMLSIGSSIYTKSN